MSTNNHDHDTWVYHALHEAKIVKASEAEKLYKQGWRDSPAPETLFQGVRGKWYRLILWFRSFKEKESTHWNSYQLATAILTVIIILVMLFTHFDNKIEKQPANVEQTKDQIKSIKGGTQSPQHLPSSCKAKSIGPVGMLLAQV